VYDLCFTALFSSSSSSSKIEKGKPKMRLILAWELEERCDINLFERLMTYMLVA